MTRDEAVKKAETHCGDSVAASRFVGIAFALGLLKLEEPKEPIDEVCAELGWGKYGKDLLNGILARANLKLVRA